MANKRKTNTEVDATEEELKIILAEVKAGKKIGRPINVDVERLSIFWFWYKQTRMIEWSLEQAKISEQTYKTIKDSKTFQRLLTLRAEDLKAVSFINLSKAVRGTPPGKRKELVWDHKAGEDGKGAMVIGEVSVPAIPGNIDDSKWLLSQVYSVGRPEASDDSVPQIGAPQNEAQAELMIKIFNGHYDHRNKQQSDTSGDGSGKSSRSKGTVTGDNTPKG